MKRTGSRVILGVCGSIAAVKAPELVRLLVDKGFDVNCVLTPEAARFVSPLALATFSGKPAPYDMFGPEAHTMSHLTLADNTDLMIIAPASASMMGRIAHGLADDMVSLCFITTKAPVLVAPAMHPPMWENPATQENLKILKARGVRFVGPAMGPLADKSHGEGRMSEPAEIVRAAEKILNK